MYLDRCHHNIGGKNPRFTIERDVVSHIFGLKYQLSSVLFYCACYVSGNSVTFFLQNTATALRLVLSFFGTFIRESALCFRISQIALGFRPMRNGKIFKRIISSYWMRSSVIWRILQIEVCVMRLIDMGFLGFFSFNMF